MNPYLLEAVAPGSNTATSPSSNDATNTIALAGSPVASQWSVTLRNTTYTTSANVSLAPSRAGVADLLGAVSGFTATVNGSTITVTRAAVPVFHGRGETGLYGRPEQLLCPGQMRGTEEAFYLGNEPPSSTSAARSRSTPPPIACRHWRRYRVGTACRWRARSIS